MKILDLACGNRKGWGCPYQGEIIGVDIDPNSQANAIHDLNKFPYPFIDNEFDAVYSNHSLEHLSNTDAVMDELWRITKPEGRITIRLPHAQGRMAFIHPGHIKFFTIHLMNYYTMSGYHSKEPKFKMLKKHINFIFQVPPNKLRWKGRLLRQLVIPLDWMINLNPELYERLGILPPDEIEWELEVIK